MCACKADDVAQLLFLGGCGGLLWLNSVPTRTWFFLLTASQALLAPPQSRCHFWDSLWFRVTEPRPGCEDRRAPGVRRAPIGPGGWPSKRQRRPLVCCRRRNIFFHYFFIFFFVGGDQCEVLSEAAALCKTLSLCAGRVDLRASQQSRSHRNIPLIFCNSSQ